MAILTRTPTPSLSRFGASSAPASEVPSTVAISSWGSPRGPFRHVAWGGVLLALTFALALGVTGSQAHAQTGSSSTAAEAAPDGTGEARPVDKPVSEMTEEERKVFRRWRRARLAEARGGEVQKEKKTAPEGAVTFDLSFPGDRGGSISGWAGGLSYERPDFAVLSDGVVVRYQDLELSADRVEVDLENERVEAFGDVVLDQGPRRLAGSSLTFDLDTKTGTVLEASAFVDPDFYFSGAEVEKTGENTYRFSDGSFTSCHGEVPAWSFDVGSAEIEIGGYATVRDASMKVKKTPVFYWPYLLWPVKTDRVSGFLVPNIGYSSQRGAYLGLGYYKTLGRSADTTFFADYYSEGFYGLGNELRWRPSENSRGRFEGYVIRDPDALPGEDEYRWKVKLDHETTDLPYGLRGVVHIEEYSDFDFFRDFERNLDRNTRRFYESRAYLSGNWGPHSLIAQIKSRDTLVGGGNTISLRQLPEVEYRLRSRQLGSTPFFVSGLSSLSYLSLDRSETLNSDYGRFDFFPELSVPLRVAPWLSVEVSGGYRFTWYGDSLQETDNTSFSGDTITRSFPVAGAQVVGPSFSRIFDVDNERWSKIKHVIEPRVSYSYRGEIDDREVVPLFDEVDSVTSTNVARVALVQRVLAKPQPKAKKPEESEDEGSSSSDADGEGDGGSDASDEAGAEDGAEVEALDTTLKELAPSQDGIDAALADAEEAAESDEPISTSAREIFSWEVARFYSFDDDQPLQGSLNGENDQAGPISNVFRLNPTERTSLTARVDYNTLFSQVTATSLSGNLGLGKHMVGLSWNTRWQAVTGDRLSDQLRFNTRLNLRGQRLQLQTALLYDIEDGEIEQQRYVVQYTSQCYGLRLEYRNFIFGQERDEDFRFSITLKNVGTFLDLNG